MQVAADMIIKKGNSIVLVKRAFPPHEGRWALPGGLVEEGKEDIFATAVREAKEETGLDVTVKRIVGVYSEPNRDPRGHVVSVCFLCSVRGGKLRQSKETPAVQWFQLKEAMGTKLAFDHNKMLVQAYGRTTQT